MCVYFSGRVDEDKFAASAASSGPTTFIHTNVHGSRACMHKSILTTQRTHTLLRSVHPLPAYNDRTPPLLCVPVGDILAELQCCCCGAVMLLLLLVAVYVT